MGCERSGRQPALPGQRELRHSIFEIGYELRRVAAVHKRGLAYQAGYFRLGLG